MHMSTLSMPIALHLRMIPMKSSNVWSMFIGGLLVMKVLWSMPLRTERPNLQRRKIDSVEYLRASLVLIFSLSGFTPPSASW